ncbi:glycosyltransferase [Falsibacillus albus]|uniref:Glycosyltransferase n=1 Tax=Falsibacillus albus TaxID=2478915 RepID=A0A3L7K110_9BACI|nr:glycosyltransferase [Falsibacillus albus]RLQ96275.1 glycosyltransferase [Falsibacillus albus]
MKKILISSFDLEVGGVERSLISLLANFDYEKYIVDLKLFSHSGEFMELIPAEPNLLVEQREYKTFRMSIKQIFQSGMLRIGISRVWAKILASRFKNEEAGYRQMQYMWNASLPFLPKLNQHYDVAVSYLWPHYFVAEKVFAKTKIAWIHTDYSVVQTDENLDYALWSKFDHIIAVSEHCKDAFLSKYPLLKNKVSVMENIATPELVISLADEKTESSFVEDNRFKLVTVARLSYAKGIDQAVLAMKILKEKGYPIVWYVVGYGGDEEEIKCLIKQNNLEKEFILLGKKINPYPYIKHADLYVQPSRYEGKALTVSEAQILSKPVLITNYPTAGSQVKNRVDGYICPLGAEGIANGIEYLYESEDLRAKLVLGCKKINYLNNEEMQKFYQLIQ